MKQIVGRIIRDYLRIADKNYHCSRCMIPIFAGDRYLGEVWVFGKRLWVERYHDYCPCDPEEEVRREKAAREDMEKEKDFPNETRDAA